MAEGTLSISLEKLATLAVEQWRLTMALTAVAQGWSGAPVRHALRKIEDFLKGCELEIRVLDGQPYDAGLAARVIDTVADPRLAKGKAVVSETLSPMILHRGTVLKPADIVVSSNV